MSEDSQTKENEHMPCCSASKEGGHCPMSAKFNDIVASAKFRMTLLGVGSVFILLGVVILVWPIVIVWLTAMVSILMGIMILMASSFLTKMNSPD
jgi:uncharacterized membrane protein